MIFPLPDLDEECHEVEKLVHGDVSVSVLVKQVENLQEKKLRIKLKNYENSFVLLRGRDRLDTVGEQKVLKRKL